MNHEQDRGIYERFAIPYSFKPQLSVLEAVAASLAGFLRIFLGSLIFAVWGTYTLVVWTRTHNLLLRIPAVLLMCGLFLVSLWLVMRAISALVARLFPKHS